MQARPLLVDDHRGAKETAIAAQRRERRMRKRRELQIVAGPEQHPGDAMGRTKAEIDALPLHRMPVEADLEGNLRGSLDQWALRVADQCQSWAMDEQVSGSELDRFKSRSGVLDDDAERTKDSDILFLGDPQPKVRTSGFRAAGFEQMRDRAQVQQGLIVLQRLGCDAVPAQQWRWINAQFADDSRVAPETTGAHHGSHVM